MKKSSFYLLILGTLILNLASFLSGLNDFWSDLVIFVLKKKRQNVSAPLLSYLLHRKPYKRATIIYSNRLPVLYQL